MIFSTEIPCLQILPDGLVLLHLYVQPRASTNSVAGLQGDMLKLRLTTPPVDGKANKAVIAYLAKLFHLPKSAIVIKSGHQSRSKIIVLKAVDGEMVRAALAALLVPTEAGGIG